VDFPLKMVIFHSYVSLPEGTPAILPGLLGVDCASPLLAPGWLLKRPAAQEMQLLLRAS